MPRRVSSSILTAAAIAWACGSNGWRVAQEKSGSGSWPGVCSGWSSSVAFFDMEVRELAEVVIDRHLVEVVHGNSRD